MRKGLLITGIILLVIGLLSIAYPMFVGSSVSIQAWPNASSPATPIAGSGTFTVHWSGATSNTYVVLYECATSDCSVPGAVLANASGASGSFSVTLVSGHSYALFETGTPISVPATVTMMGLSALVLIGIVLLVIGLVVTGLSFRRSAAAPAEEPAPAPAPDSGEDSMIMPEIPREAPPPAPPAPARPAPAYVRSPDEPAPKMSEQPTAGTRADRKCASCGTMNEPWITNCRKCKRPLASTSR